MKYLVWQMEIAPTTGMQHVQGYVRFSVKKELQTARRLLSDRAHLQEAKGTEQQNKDYCTKEGGTEKTEHGEFDAEAGNLIE